MEPQGEKDLPQETVPSHPEWQLRLQTRAMVGGVGLCNCVKYRGDLGLEVPAFSLADSVSACFRHCMRFRYTYAHVCVNSAMAVLVFVLDVQLFIASFIPSLPGHLFHLRFQAKK